MVFLVRSSRLHKGVFLFLALAVLGGYAVHEAVATSGGILGQSKKGCGGYGCHGTQSNATVISLSTSATQIVVGQTYDFQISVANPSEIAAGFNLSVDTGAKVAATGYDEIAFKNPNTRVWELTHSQPKTFIGDSTVWTFKYTAPAKPGTYHIYAAGNAVNLDSHADAQDRWNTIIDTLTVVAQNAVIPFPAARREFTISPNPSRGRITVSSSGLTGPANLEVSDASGRVVFREELSLEGESPLDFSTLPNGSYFLSLKTRDGQSFVRRIVIER